MGFGESEPPTGAPAGAPRFRLGLVGIFLIGLMIRVAYAVSRTKTPLPGDARFFHATALDLSAGKGYLALSDAGGLRVVETGNHPPFFPLLLTVLDWVGIQSVDAQRVAVAVMASIGVVIVGLLGKKVGGAGAGLMAAGIAAVDPLWFQSSGILMSESIYLVLVPGILLMALRCLERQSYWRFGGLGVLIALAVLTRSEAIELVVLLGIPVVLMASREWKSRVLHAFGFAAGFALILTPWLVRNEVQLGGLVLSDNGGATLAGSYCAATLDSSKPVYGSFDVSCTYAGVSAVLRQHPPIGRGAWSELLINNALATSSVNYAKAHLRDLPGVVLAREELAWGLGSSHYQQVLATAEGRQHSYESLGNWLYWVLLPFGLGGAMALGRRSWREFTVVAAPIAAVVVSVAAFYGSTRMRVAAEPSLAVLAALGIVSVARWARLRSVTQQQGGSLSE
jgi:Dolichyl-phosphate-mannose-protein mannosyltransferase